MDYKQTLLTSFQSIWIILKLVIPIYIIADVLFYYNTLSHVAFIIEPITTLIGLPPEASLSIISGMFLNVYAAIAFAAPLDLSVHQWTILAVFIGILFYRYRLVVRAPCRYKNGHRKCRRHISPRILQRLKLPAQRPARRRAGCVYFLSGSEHGNVGNSYIDWQSNAA